MRPAIDKGILAIVAAGSIFSFGAAAQTPANEAETAIRGALTRWTADFNARDTARICDLFAPDLVYDYRGFPERTHADLCGLLLKSLADRTKQFTYALDIKEIIVSGDMAVVRLVWTLTVWSGLSRRRCRAPQHRWYRRSPASMSSVASPTAIGGLRATSPTRRHDGAPGHKG
jgi:steroid delta-isomerase